MDLETKIILSGPQLQIIDYKIRDYQEVLLKQQQFRELRLRDEIPDTVIFVEHEPVYTLGKDVTKEQALIKSPLPAPLIRIERGGKITYHGPGQLVAYFIFKMPLRKIGEFVDSLEQITIKVLRDYGVAAYSRKEEKDAYGKNIRGAWCRVRGIHKKISAQGIETKRAILTNEEPTIVTMHGFALNINTDLRYFRCINPCGFTYEVMSSLQEVLGNPGNIEAVKKTVQNYIQELVNNKKRE